MLPATSQFDLFLSSPNGFECEFRLELRIADGWSVSVAREECHIRSPRGDRHYYIVESGSVTGSAAIFPPVSTDRVFLSNASGLPEFRLPFDFLSAIGSTEPMLPGIHFALQRLHLAVNRQSAKRTGVAARFRNFIRDQPQRLEILHQYLRAIAPPFDHIEVAESNDVLWLYFVEKTQSGAPMPFHITQASAGLMSAAEILLELFGLPEEGKPASAVVIEEPEAFLHPGAIQVIRDAVLEASRTRQVLVTTHSPDLLDDPTIPAEWIRIVFMDQTGTMSRFWILAQSPSLMISYIRRGSYSGRVDSA